MTSLRKPLPRRTLLRGLGAAIGLPILDAMAAPGKVAAANTTNAIRRLLFLYVPNGVITKNWLAAPEAPSFVESPTLRPLAAFQNDILLLSGLCHRNAEAQGDGPGDHARASASYLTGVHPKKSATDVRVGISVDQLAAQAIGHQTRLPSLELTTDRGQLSGACDSGYSCAYQNAFSWRSATSPLPAEVNPRFVFDRLFGGGAAVPQTMMANKSVLDFVAEDARRLATNVGADDRRKLEEYLSSVRGVEQQIAHTMAHPPPRVPPGALRPGPQPSGFEHHLRLMSDLLVLALQTDTTRVATLIFARELSNRTYPWLGAHSGHHDMSHHMNNPEKIETLGRIDHYHVQQLAYLMGQLKRVNEAGRPLLDSCLLVYGSGLSDGNRHLHKNLPTLVAGGGGALKMGRHLHLPEATPMCNLWLSLLQECGVKVQRFGDSTGPIEGLHTV